MMRRSGRGYGGFGPLFLFCGVGLAVVGGGKDGLGLSQYVWASWAGSGAAPVQGMG